MAVISFACFRVLPDWRAKQAPTEKRFAPPEEIGSNFYPLRGPYSSRNFTVVREHFREIRQSGIGESNTDVFSVDFS